MKLTTTHLQLPSPRAWWNLPTPVAAAICIFCLLAIAAMVGRIQQTPIAAAVPTPALDPIIIIASPLPVVPPTAAAVIAAVPSNALRRAVVAYDSPANGNALGAIEAGRIYHLLARFGSEWLQADVAGSGVVWLRSSEVLDLPADLADLKPTDAPRVVERQPVYVNQPAMAVPTPTEQGYAVTNTDPDFYAPPATSLEARQALIGSDPDALACGGSPMCNGLTNREAQAALDAERAAQP